MLQNVVVAVELSRQIALRPRADPEEDLNSEGDSRIVFSDSVSLECDAGTSADAVAERIFALAGGDLFGKARGEPPGA